MASAKRRMKAAVAMAGAGGGGSQAHLQGKHVGTGRAEPSGGEMGARWPWGLARSCWV